MCCWRQPDCVSATRSTRSTAKKCSNICGSVLNTRKKQQQQQKAPTTCITKMPHAAKKCAHFRTNGNWEKVFIFDLCYGNHAECSGNELGQKKATTKKRPRNISEMSTCVRDFANRHLVTRRICSADSTCRSSVHITNYLSAACSTTFLLGHLPHYSEGKDTTSGSSHNNNGPASASASKTIRHSIELELHWKS